MDSSGLSTDADDGGSPEGDLIGKLDDGRRRFLELVAPVRAELHRYCTRMTGSVIDGEDVVQDTLARACYELSQLKALPPLRPWLFRIAHNRAIDHWRHETHRHAEPLDAALDIAAEVSGEPDSVLARHQAVRAALSCFLELAPAQRGCVILKDVLDHSLDDIAAELELSIPAVKAALHRGRAILQRFAAASSPMPPQGAASPEVKRYARLFNAHDWDGVRSLLAEDVRLDLVSKLKAAGRREVGTYFSNYERIAAWHLTPAWLDGREVLAVMLDGPAGRARYVIELSWRDGQVTAIRDFRYVPYIAEESVLGLST